MHRGNASIHLLDTLWAHGVRNHRAAARGHLAGAQTADLPSPTPSSLVSRTHAGIRRSIGTAQPGKTPALVDDLKLMLSKLPSTRVGIRDRPLRTDNWPLIGRQVDEIGRRLQAHHGTMPIPKG